MLNLTIAQTKFQTKPLSLIFVFCENIYCFHILLIFDTCKWNGYAIQLHRCIPKEGGWDAGVDRSSLTSSLGFLFQTQSWQQKFDRKFVEFTSVEKYTQPQFIK
jgi:hypothetical protein